VGDLHVRVRGGPSPNAGGPTPDASRPGPRPTAKGGWRIHGRKIWTTKALESEVVLPDRPAPATRDSGLKGLSLFLADLDRELRRHPPRSRRSGRNAGWLRARVAYDGLPVEDWRLIGEENEGFRLLLHGLNPERILLSSEACGIGEVRARPCHEVREGTDRVRSPDRRPIRRSAIRWRWARIQLPGGVDDGTARGATLRLGDSIAERSRQQREIPRGPKPRSSPPTAPCRHWAGMGLRERVPRGAILA